MSTIGTFEKDDTGTIEGKLCGLGIGIIPVAFVRNANKKDSQPDYYLVANPDSADAYRMGRAWEPRAGRDHHFVKIESPFLSTPVIRASLFPDRNIKGKFNLIYYAPEDSAPKADATAEMDQSSPVTSTRQQQRQRVAKGASVTPKG